jgi:hypothetical protein
MAIFLAKSAKIAASVTQNHWITPDSEVVHHVSDVVIK